MQYPIRGLAPPAIIFPPLWGSAGPFSGARPGHSAVEFRDRYQLTQTSRFPTAGFHALCALKLAERYLNLCLDAHGLAVESRRLEKPPLRNRFHSRFNETIPDAAQHFSASGNAILADHSNPEDDLILKTGQPDRMSQNIFRL